MLGSKGSFGSLTLGGSDISKYVPTNISFSLASDVARDLVVGIKSITSTYNNGSVSSLLPSPTLAFIDSTVPYLYLPEDACKAFESELGLVYNKTNNLYFVDDALHQTLTNINPKFTFRLANDKSSDPFVDIILPYASFDLVLKPPLRSNATSYFPLRRGNDSQITLGRAFLQEAYAFFRTFIGPVLTKNQSYIITDYDHQNFTVAQTRFDDTARPNIVPIPWNATVAPRVSEGLSRQATIGISTGSAILASLLIILALFCTFRWRKHRSATALTDRLIGSDALHEVTPVPYISIQELGHKSIPEMHGTGYHLELLDDSTPSGSGNDLTELADGVETPRRPSVVPGTRDNYGQAADASSRARSDASGDLLKDPVTRRPTVGNGPRKNATRSSHTTQTSRDTRTSLRVTKRTTRTSSQTRVRINVNKALPSIPQGKPPCHESHRSSGALLGLKVPPVAYESNRSSLAHRTISEAASPLSPVRTYATIFDVEEYQDSAIVTKTEYGSF